MNRNQKIISSIVLAIVSLVPKVSAESPYIYQYMDDLLKWRTSESLSPLPPIVTLPSGIKVPEYTNKTDLYPGVDWKNNPMIGAIPFIVKILSHDDSEQLLSEASDTLQRYYNSASRKHDMGFQDASPDDIYILALVETYRHTSLFSPTVDGSIVFVFIRKEDINKSKLYLQEDIYQKYMPWPPGGMHFLILERLPDGSFKVNREGAAG